MIDKEELRRAMRERGLKYGYVAEKMGISMASLNRKMEGVTDFKASEIVSMTSILGLSREQRSLFIKFKLYFSANSIHFL